MINSEDLMSISLVVNEIWLLIINSKNQMTLTFDLVCVCNVKVIRVFGEDPIPLLSIVNEL